jgi:hypothetical protein
MRGGLPRLNRPFQVLCVWAVVLLLAAVSLQVVPYERAGVRLTPEKRNLGTLGERLITNTISIITGNPDCAYLSIASDLSAALDDGDIGKSGSGNDGGSAGSFATFGA